MRADPGNDGKFVDFPQYLLDLSLSCAYPLATLYPTALSALPPTLPLPEPCLARIPLPLCLPWDPLSLGAKAQSTGIEMTQNE